MPLFEQSPLPPYGVESDNAPLPPFEVESDNTPPPAPILEADPMPDTAAPLPLPAPVPTLPVSLLGATGGGTFAQPGTAGAIPFRTPNFGVNRYIGPELIRGPGVPNRGRGRRPWDDPRGRRV